MAQDRKVDMSHRLSKPITEKKRMQNDEEEEEEEEKGEDTCGKGFMKSERAPERRQRETDE